MKCILGSLFFLFCWYSVSTYGNKEFLQTFESIMDNASVSKECQNSIQLIFDKFELTIDNWAFQMVDATSKIPVGILSYNFGELGQFSQCLNIEAEDGAIKGKYCLGSISLTDDSNGTKNTNSKLINKNKDIFVFHMRAQLVSDMLTRLARSNRSLSQTAMTWAICLPKNCSDADGSIILKQVIGSEKVNCQTKEDITSPLTNGAIAAITVFAFFACLLVASTAVDLYYRYYAEKRQLHLLFKAFSMYSNGKTLFHVNSDFNELTCLNGIRFITTLWVLITHAYFAFIASPLTNFKDIMELMDSTRSMIFINATLSVDSFLVLSGALLVYNYFKAQHYKVPFNIFTFYIHRYLSVGNGPNWNNVDTFQDSCQKYWWVTLLNIQNYANKIDEFCLPHTWSLNVDMQLFIISPLVVIPLWKFPRIGVWFLILEIITFIVISFYTAFVTDIPVFLTNFQARVPIDDYVNYYYIKTHIRATTWLIGALLGYILAKIKFHGTLKNFKIPKVTVLVVWGICIAIGLTCVYGGHDRLSGSNYNKWESSLHLALVRPVWALFLCWVVYACVSGYGGPINWLLSLPIYQVLNRLTYSVFLLHFPLQFALAFMQKSGMYYTEVNALYSAWGINLLTFALSVVWVLAFELPVVVLERWIFSNYKKKSIPEKND